MNEINSILIVGLGAIGSAVAQKLHDHLPGQVRVLAGGERARRYREQGIIINGLRYDLPLSAPADTDENEPAEPADLILVAVKDYDLAAAIEQMRGHVGPQTIILSLMNGITSEARLGEAFGMERILYGLVIGIDGNRSGNQVRFTSAGRIMFGEPRNQPWSEKVARVARLFEAAGVVHAVPEDMLHALWYKFMINVGINQVSGALLAPYGVFQRIPEAEALVESAMNEVIRIAACNGIALGEPDILNWRQVLAGMNPDSHTSMADDLRHGRRTEVEMLAGTVGRLGRDCGVPTPVNDLLYQMILIRERMGNPGQPAHPGQPAQSAQPTDPDQAGR